MPTTSTPPRSETVFVAHYAQRVEGRVVAARVHRLHAVHHDAALALARSKGPAYYAVVGVRPADDKDGQSWL